MKKKLQVKSSTGKRKKNAAYSASFVDYIFHHKNYALCNPLIIIKYKINDPISLRKIFFIERSVIDFWSKTNH